MKIQTFSVGPLATNCYLITDEETGEAAVVDPGAAEEPLLRAVRREHVGKILLTHGHFDHVGGAEALRRLTGAQVYLLREEEALLRSPFQNLSAQFLPEPLPEMIPDVLLQDGTTVPLGSLSFQVLHTPGHTAGSCCYCAPGALFTGDTLMQGSVGRTDFPTGSFAALSRSLQALRLLDGGLAVYPGHGPATQLGVEKRSNPYLREESGYGFAN